MAQLFPRWTNRIPVFFVSGLLLTVGGLVFLFSMYASPKYLNVGYRPKQPVAYSHKLHAGDMAMDCRYCHTSVERSAVSNVPPTQTCMNCHKVVLPKSEKLLPVRESWESGKPIEWVRVHKVADYAYFNHSAHVTAGVGCASCHGNVAQMDEKGVMLSQPLSMGWCLDCHRNPDEHLRPVSEVTNMDWVIPANQKEFAAKVKSEKKIKPPVDCSGCHR
ncbi:MAG: cytochrome c3 family protein [Chloroherpetonaceae bacterium]|nr:cytochrome c3 family protein [Chloroherpetonaceae bacterium]